MPVLLAPPWKRRPGVDPADASLAAELSQRRASAREAEAVLRGLEAHGAPAEEVALARRLVDRRLGAALESAEAAYRVTLGPLEGMRRTAYLRRLARSDVRAADQDRREVALARTHLRVESRDDLATTALGSVPPSVGTAALELGTHTSGH